MIIYGASGHGKVIFSIIGEEVSVFFDDNENIKTFCSKEVVNYNRNILPAEPIVVAIGNNEMRKKIVSKIKHAFSKVIHKSAQIDESVLIDQGTQIVHNAIIQTSAVIGRHCIINTGASIDHDCVIEDFCHIAPQVTLCGNVDVGEGTLIGAESTVIPGIKIGRWCIIGAGSIVINDIPDYATAVGNPAKVIKINEA